MSFWPFAVCLLGLLIFVFLWFGATSERDNSNAVAAKAQAAAKQADEEKNAANTRLLAVSKAVGFQTGGNFTDAAEIDRQVKEYAAKIKEAATTTYPVSRYQADPAGGQVEKADAGTVTVTYLTEQEIADTQNLQGWFPKFETALARAKHDGARGFEHAETLAKEKDEITKANEATLKDKDKRISDLTGEKTALENQAREKENELNDKISQLTGQRDAKETELEALKKQSSENEAKLLSQITESKQTISSLVQQNAPTLSEGPDGEVIVADAGMAIINRGQSSWLMPGTIFDVWGLAKGGAKYKKGTIKVTSCDVETARAAVIEEDPRDPVQKGDLIQSMTYSPNRQLHFVLVGEFRKMGKSTAEAVLKKLGAAVDSKVTANTNYLVVGAPGAGQETLDDTDAVRTAKELGIRMITEEQLASFTRY
jgi:uncharacterized protein (UPF0333 family)